MLWKEVINEAGVMGCTGKIMENTRKQNVTTAGKSRDLLWEMELNEKMPLEHLKRCTNFVL